MSEPIKVDLRTIKLHGFVSRNPDEFAICADVPGQEPYLYYDVPIIKEKAVSVAARRGITLPDMADIWNAQLNKLQEKVLADLGIPVVKIPIPPEQAQNLWNLLNS